MSGQELRRTYSDKRNLFFPTTPGARSIWVDHVLKDGALLPKEVASPQLEAGRLRAPLHQPVDQVAEECVKSLPALLRHCRAKAPEDGKEKLDLHWDLIFYCSNSQGRSPAW